jgi:addiction module RelB/DinJ family antitoxin
MSLLIKEICYDIVITLLYNTLIRRNSIMASTFIQIRTDEKDKKEASAILEALGTNLSAVLNMTIKQVILQKRVPFDISLPKEYVVSNVAASMAMENMDLDANEIKELDAFHKMNTKDQENEIQELVSKYKEKSHG